jgi:hypothetical protein
LPYLLRVPLLKSVLIENAPAMAGGAPTVVVVQRPSVREFVDPRFLEPGLWGSAPK